MKKRNNIIFICLVMIIAFGAFAYVLVRAVYYAPNDEIAITPLAEKKLIKKSSDIKASTPINSFQARLTIPTLDVNAKIKPVGITRKGNMSTPNNFFDVGLYKYGPNPGEMGSAIIAGHVDNGLGLKAVFGDLEKIRLGDDIYVEMEKGKNIHFVVVDTKKYDFDAPADEVFNQNDGIYLKLITCSGVWVPEYRTHDKRLVVTAKFLE